MDIIKVDIETGRVIINNLHQHWDKLATNPGIKDPVIHYNPAITKNPPMDRQLMQRVRIFNRHKNRAWPDEELYLLAVMAGKQKKNIEMVADRLRKSKTACRKQFYSMKKAGVI